MQDHPPSQPQPLSNGSKVFSKEASLFFPLIRKKMMPFDVCNKYANLMKRGRGNSRAPLLRLQRVKRLAIAYHNRNRNRNCGGAAKCGVSKLRGIWTSTSTVKTPEEQ